MEFLVTALRWIVAFVGMGAVAWIAWKLVQKQEPRDPAYRKKLDDDDARVAKGRFGPQK